MKPASLLLKLSKRYTWSIAVTILTMLGLVAAQLIIPWLIRALINTLSTSSLAGPTLDSITRLSGIALLVFIARGFMQYVRSFQAHIAGWGVVADSRKLVYQQLQRLSLRYYEDKQTGQLMSRVINDTELFERMIAHALPDVFVNVVTLIGVSAILFSMSWKLTLLTMAPIPVIALTLMLYAKMVRPAFRYRQNELGELNAVLNDSLSGVREIKAFAHEDIAMVKVGARIENYLRSNLKALKIMAIFMPVLDFAAGSGQLIVIYFGSRMALGGSIQIADLVAFFLYLDSFYQPVRNLNNAWEAVQESMAGFERVAEILDESPEIAEPEEPVALPKPVRGALRFENVSFHYTPQETILKDISLDIPAGSTLALVGPTGVGKSTLASLIPRFYDVCAEDNPGRVDIRSLDTKELPSNQYGAADVSCFNQIRGNILLANTTKPVKRKCSPPPKSPTSEFHPAMPTVRHDV